MANEHRFEEVERKYDVAADTGEVPDLAVLPGVAGVAPVEERDQTATYVDTDDLALFAAGVTLRRRIGGVDEGWHLKLPAGADRRHEFHAPIADRDDPDEAVPADLADIVRAVVRDHRLTPVAVLRTRRRVHRLLGPGEAVLAELCDDRVEARTTRGDATTEQWREWELELVDGAVDLLDLAEPVLIGAGAEPSTTGSKLARALGGSRPPRAPWRTAGPVGRKASTGKALTAYLGEHFLRLQAEDRRLRVGDQEGIHKLRIQARRIRSALATCAPVLEPGATEGLRDELRWLGGVLAPARDAQVLRERLLDAVAGQPEVLVLGPVGRRIDDDLRETYRSRRAAALEELGGERYFRLLDRLEALLDDVPCSPDAAEPARRMLPVLLRRDLRRVRKRHRAYLAADTPESRDQALHDVRKAAKRLRYAADTAVPVFGKRARKLSARAKAVQQVLGEHQDSVVARPVLRDLGVRAHLSGENGFTFGRLHAAEETSARRLTARYPDVYDGLPAPSRLRSWLRG